MIALTNAVVYYRGILWFKKRSRRTKRTPQVINTDQGAKIYCLEDNVYDGEYLGLQTNLQRARKSIADVEGDDDLIRVKTKGKKKRSTAVGGTDAMIPLDPTRVRGIPVAMPAVDYQLLQAQPDHDYQAGQVYY